MKKINILLPILVFLPLTNCSSGSFNPNDNQPDELCTPMIFITLFLMTK